MEDAAQQVDIGPGPDVRAPSFGQLGGKVLRRPATGRQRALVHKARVSGGLPDIHRQTPVEQQHLAVAAEHDVGRLEIIVHDAAAVGVGHSVAELHQHLHVEDQICGLLPLQQRVPGLSFDQAHHQEGLALVVPEVVDRHDVGVFQPAGGQGLRDEGTAPLTRKHGLERDVTIERGLLRTVDHPHAASADLHRPLVASSRQSSGGPDGGGDCRQGRRFVGSGGRTRGEVR